MRVLCLHNRDWVIGGADSFFRALIDLLAREHEVVGFAPQGPADRKGLPGVHHVPVGPSRAAQALYRIGGSFYSSRSRKDLSRLLDRTPVDVAHVHSWAGGLSVAVLRELRERGIPVVQTLHEYKYLCPTWRFLAQGEVCERCRGGRYYHCLFAGCAESTTRALLHTVEHYWLDRVGWDALFARYISPSRFLLEKHVEFGFKPEKMVHLPHFIEVSRFQPADRKGDYVLFCGRLSQEKGLGVLVEAMRRVKGLRCVIAGTGPERERLEPVCLRDRLAVEFAGYQSGEALHRLIGEARALVLPSLWYENQPVSILEAYALGTAVIGSDFGGLRELVDDGVEGYRFPLKDAGALADCIERLAGDPRPCIEMGRMGRARVERDHTPEVHLARLRSVYEAVTAPAR